MIDPLFIADWVTNIVSYLVGGIICAIWIRQDLKARAQARKKQRESSSCNVDSLGVTISPSLHYSSIVVYIVCISQCIFGILGILPYVCQYYMVNIRVFMFGCSKGTIMLFQVQRLMLCFGNNWYFTSLTIVICLAIIWGAYYSLIQMKTHFDISRFYGCWVATNISNTLQMFAIILLLDWTVLLTYYIKIERMKRRWNKFQIPNQSTESSINENIGNTGVKSNKQENMKQWEKSNKFNVSRRLNFILKKILFLSLLMEIPITLSSILFLVGQVGTIASMAKHIFMAIDSATNILFVSYMLQYNKCRFDHFLTKYNHFIKYFICFNCLLFQTKNENSYSDKKSDSRKLQTSVERHKSGDESPVTATQYDQHISIEIKSAIHSQASKDENHHFVE